MATMVTPRRPAINRFPEPAERPAADKCEIYLASSLHWKGNGERERTPVHPSPAKEHGLYVALADVLTQ